MNQIYYTCLGTNNALTKIEYSCSGTGFFNTFMIIFNQKEREVMISIPDILVIRKFCQTEIQDNEFDSNVMKNSTCVKRGINIAPVKVQLSLVLMLQTSQEIQLAKPNSLMENYQAIPKVITMFFDGFIGVILKHHHELRQYKRKYYNLKTKIDDTEQDPMQLIKITTFLSSIIIKMAFRRSKIWFTNLFASLCRRPQFLGSLQLILRSLHVISHTEDHEHHLEIKRMEKVDPKSRIISGRTSFHVVLRICFFFILPLPICEIVGEESMIYEKKTIFGFNQFSSEKIKLFEDFFKRLLNYQTSLSGASFNKVDDEEIYQEIIKHIPKGTLLLENPPNSFIKVWILYWRWSSLLRFHKLGIRIGNWDFQIESLRAFGKYKANSLKEPLWKLTTNLLDLFENFDSNMTHHLIEKAPELTTDGFNSLFNSYDIGKRRMETLLNQEVYGTGEINTIGRRSTNVKRKEKLEENIEATERPSNFKNNPIDLSVPIEEGESSNKRRRTTEHEHSILDPLVEMYTKPTKDQINRAIEKTRWDRKRVLGYVDKHRKKKETQQQ
ncbi:9355_t:CDS:2 [Entrophospora sp. SA101]|nr:9355_t:CDS:2 [Entrophospora sp. SA101]